MRLIVATLLLAAACTSAPAGSTAEPAAASEPTLHLTESLNGAGIIALDPLTLQDRSERPVLPLSATTANNSSTVASPDGSAIAVMTYGYGDAPAVARGLDIAVFDARAGTLRARFNPEVPVIVDGLSANGTRIYARNWPPADFMAARLVLDATNGRIVEREPQFVIAGDVVARTSDEKARRLYGLLVPIDPGATGPRAVDLAGWDLRAGTQLWRLRLPSLMAGEWKTGRVVGGVDVRSRLVPGLALSPDGRQIAVVDAFGCCGSPRTVWLIDAGSGALLSQRTYGLGTSFIDRLFAPSIAIAKSLDESVVVNASFSPDGQLLYAHSQSARVDDQGEPRHQYFGMVAVALRDAAVRGHDIKIESYWFNNRIAWIRPSPDGKWLYVFLHHSGGADPQGGHFLRRLDASTLRVLAERRFDGHREPFLLATN